MGALLRSSVVGLCAVASCINTSFAGNESLEFSKSAPTGFAVNEKDAVDAALVFRGVVYRNIVFVEKVDTKDQFVLVQSSVKAWRKLLLTIGFDWQAVEEYVSLDFLEVNKPYCLALAATPQTCVDVQLDSKPKDSMLELVIRGDGSKLVSPDLVSNEVSLVGTTYLYGASTTDSAPVGVVAGSSVQTASFGLSNRGVASLGPSRVEYDLAYTGQNASAYGQPATSQLHFNTLAAGTNIGGGVGFAGLFRAASGGQAFGLSGTTDFFSKPAQIGVAWQSDSSNLSTSNRKRSVRVQLASPSQIRIQYNGVQLQEAWYVAGNHQIPINGYADAFVDVIVRDANGHEESRKAEVITDYVPVQADIGVKGERSLWYADIGSPLDTTTDDNRMLKHAGSTQGNLSYSYLGDTMVYQVAGQVVNQHSRISSALSDRDSHWRYGGLIGLNGEKGLRASFIPQLGDLRLGMYGTKYVPPASGGVVDPSCYESGNLYCFSGAVSGYQSFGINAGMKGYPISVGITRNRSGDLDQTMYTLTSSHRLPSIFGGIGQLMTYANYNPDANSYSVNLTALFSLESPSGRRSFVTGGYSSDQNSNSAKSLSYTTSFDPAEWDYLRGISANLQTTAGQDSINLQMSSQLGAFSNTSSASKNTSGQTGLFTQFTANYGVSGAGLAFGREGQGVGASDLFDGQGQAGVTIINRSQEHQTVMVQGRQTQVPPRTNVLIPVGGGYVRDVTASPGPVANMDDAKAGRLLHKGNIKAITIEDGFWVLAKFFEYEEGQVKPVKNALPVEFTYKRPGEKIERIYSNSTGETSLFEFKENGDHIERFVSARNSPNDFRCFANSDDIPKEGDMSSYKELSYRCTRLPVGAPLKADARNPFFAESKVGKKGILTTASVSNSPNSIENLPNLSLTREMPFADPLKDAVLEEAKIMGTLRAFAKARTVGDLQLISHFLSDEVQTSPQMAMLLRQVGYVSVADLEVQIRGNTAKAVFSETVISDRLSKRSIQSVDLKSSGEKWLITGMGFPSDGDLVSRADVNVAQPPQ